jgi:hypothetical protein
MFQTTAEPARAADFVEAFGKTLELDGLHAALRLLNATTTYRFTGVYCFEPDWVRSFVLFDRQNPTLEVGANVRMKESYCMYTARAGEPLVIENAPADPQWIGHAARDSVLSYVAVLLSDAAGAALGTLCHFDFCSRELPPGTLDLLLEVRDTVQAHLQAQGLVAHQSTSFA